MPTNKITIKKNFNLIELYVFSLSGVLHDLLLLLLRMLETAYFCDMPA